MSHELNVVLCTIEFLNDKQIVYTKYMYTSYNFIVVWYMSGNLLLFVIAVKWQNSSYVHLSKHNSFSLFQFHYTYGSFINILRSYSTAASVATITSADCYST